MNNEELFLEQGDVVKELGEGNLYYCIKTLKDQALIAPTSLNEENEWSFFMNETVSVSNKKSDYDLNDFEFIKRK